MANGRKYPRKWERISDETFRLKVNGGWWIRETLMIIVGDKIAAASVDLGFHVDPEHDWVLEDK